MYRFAIIGCGDISSKHAAAIREIGKLSALCDIVPEKADEAGKAYGCRVYYDIGELLKKETKVDVISICTPNGIHAEHIIKSLQAYKDVYCETAFCLTSAAAWQIIETAKFSRRQLFLANRFRDHFTEQMIAHIKAATGKIQFRLNCHTKKPAQYFSSWRGKEFPGGGLLYSEFSDYLDIISFLFGEPEKITTSLSNISHKDSIGFEDNGIADLKMKNGVTGTIEWSVNNPGNETKLEITAPGTSYIFKGAALHTEPAISEFNEEAFYRHSYARMLHRIENKIVSTDVYDGMHTTGLIENIYKSTSVIK
jgi:UDP-N-acetyl-2-amino-2-deoxyglucuronate dehydrogenase